MIQYPYAQDGASIWVVAKESKTADRREGKVPTISEFCITGLNSARERLASERLHL
jgi:hypothetical protein